MYSIVLIPKTNKIYCLYQNKSWIELHHGHCTAQDIPECSRIGKLCRRSRTACSSRSRPSSVRIQKLEDTLGQRLFQRSKSGVSLTPDGAKFEPYARSALQLWDEAVYQVSLRDGITGSLSLACEDTLWPELASIWLGELSAALPSTAFNFQIGTPAKHVEHAAARRAGYCRDVQSGNSPGFPGRTHHG